MTNERDTTDREIVQRRLVNAPRDLVWVAFTEQKHVDQWWGPNGFRNTTKRMQVKVGGEWIFEMAHKEYGTFPNKIVYLEVKKPELLVFDHGDGDGPPQFRSVITFVQKGKKTEVTMRAVFPSQAIRDQKIKDVNAIEGGKQTLDKLEAWLAQAQAA